MGQQARRRDLHRLQPQIATKPQPVMAPSVAQTTQPAPQPGTIRPDAGQVKLAEDAIEASTLSALRAAVTTLGIDCKRNSSDSMVRGLERYIRSGPISKPAAKPTLSESIQAAAQEPNTQSDGTPIVPTLPEQQWAKPVTGPVKDELVAEAKRLGLRGNVTGWKVETLRTKIVEAKATTLTPNVEAKTEGDVICDADERASLLLPSWRRSTPRRSVNSSPWPRRRPLPPPELQSRHIRRHPTQKRKWVATAANSRDPSQTLHRSV